MRELYLKKTDNKILVYIAIVLGIFFILSQFHDWANSLTIKLHFCSHTACIVYSLIWLAFGVIGLNKIRRKERIGKINILPYIVILIVGIVLMNITYCDAEGDMHFQEGWAFLYPKVNVTESIPVPIPPCMETDSGRDYITFGEIRSGADVPDRCMGADILRERYCDSELTYTSEDISCSAELGSYLCEGGECVYFEPIACEIDGDCDEGYICIDEVCTIEWTETDGGYDPDEYGECIHSRDDSLSVEDYCLDDETLMEYWIESYELVSEEVICTGLCVGGECVERGCSETDGGYDVGNFGITTEDGIDYADFCEDDGDLTEYECSEGVINFMYIRNNIDCGAIELYDLCFEGECIASEGATEDTRELCSDGEDNDNDEAVDCLDPDCLAIEGLCIDDYSCEHGSSFYDYPTCGGTCPTGEECITYYAYDGTLDGGWCTCMPIGETSCGDSEYPACGGWCLINEMCIADVFGCFCSFDYGICEDTDGGDEPTIPGTVTAPTLELTDFCSGDGMSVYEYSCGVVINLLEYDCAYLLGESAFCESDKFGGACISGAP